MTRSSTTPVLSTFSAPLAVAVLLMSVLFAAQAWASLRSGEPFNTVLFILGSLVCAGAVLDSRGRRVQLLTEQLAIRDWRFRTVLVAYRDVERLTYFRSLGLFIRLTNGRVEQWPAKTRDIDHFIDDLLQRVTQVRALELVGDFEEANTNDVYEGSEDAPER